MYPYCIIATARITWDVRIVGLSDITIASICRADAIVFAYTAGSASSLTKCKELVAGVPSFVRDDMYTLILAVSHSKASGSDIEANARRYIGEFLRSSLIPFRGDNPDTCHAILNFILQVCEHSLNQKLFAVRACEDGIGTREDVPNVQFHFHKDDVFLLEQSPDTSNPHALVNFVGTRFRVPVDSFRVIRDPTDVRLRIIDLTVPHVRTAQTQKEKFKVYMFVCETNRGITFESFKRYSDLRRFYATLADVYPTAVLPRFPSKKVFNSKSVIEQRRLQIERCFRAATADPLVAGSGIVEEYLIDRGKRLSAFGAQVPSGLAAGVQDMKISSATPSRPNRKVPTGITASGSVVPPNAPPATKPASDTHNSAAPPLQCETPPASPPPATQEDSKASPPASSPTAPSGLEHIHYLAQVIYNFTPRGDNAGELAISTGDVVETFASLDGWCYGRVFCHANGEHATPAVGQTHMPFGIFPESYVALLDSHDCIATGETVSNVLERPMPMEVTVLSRGAVTEKPASGDSTLINFSGFYLDGAEFDASYYHNAHEMGYVEYIIGRPLSEQPPSTAASPSLCIPELCDAIAQLYVNDRVLLTLFLNERALMFDIELCEMRSASSQVAAHINSSTNKSRTETFDLPPDYSAPEPPPSSLHVSTSGAFDHSRHSFASRNAAVSVPPAVPGALVPAPVSVDAVANRPSFAFYGAEQPDTDTYDESVKPYRATTTAAASGAAASAANDRTATACNTCNCSAFVPNVFKPRQCSSCWHQQSEHGTT
jgi:PX domain